MVDVFRCDGMHDKIYNNIETILRLSADTLQFTLQTHLVTIGTLSDNHKQVVSGLE